MPALRDGISPLTDLPLGKCDSLFAGAWMYRPFSEMKYFVCIFSPFVRKLSFRTLGWFTKEGGREPVKPGAGSGSQKIGEENGKPLSRRKLKGRVRA